MERWCRFVVILITLSAAEAATVSSARPSEFPPATPSSNSPLVANATIGPVFHGFNYLPLPAPMTAFLNASATGGTPPYRYAWDFGDGATSASQNATHVYFVPGTYIAILTVTDSGGRSAAATVVAAPTSADGIHWVVAQPNPSLGPSPLDAHFAVTEMGQLPTSYEWRFGDGASANSSEANYTYLRAGTYLARLNVTGPDRVNATYLMTVIALDGGSPKALTTVSMVGYCYSDIWNRASFKGLVGGGTPPYAFSWHFGEGNASSTLQDPRYGYNATGFHEATLTVTDSAGLVATASVSSIAIPPPCLSRAESPWLGVILAAAGVGTVLAVVAYFEARKRRGP